MRASQAPGRAGELMLHPLVVWSVFVLLVNDHWWKGRGPGLVTGKLSDVAGSIVVLAVAVRAADGWRSRHGRSTLGRRDLWWLASGVVAVAAAAKLTAAGGAAAGWIGGLARWPIDVVLSRSWTTPTPASVAADPTDILAVALGAAAFVAAIGYRRPRDGRSRARHDQGRVSSDVGGG